MVMVTKPVKMVTWGFHWLWKSHDTLIKWSCKITWKLKNISTTKVPMVTKPDRIVTYCNGLLLIKSQDNLITWFCEIPEKLKLFYLHYHGAYGHQTLQYGNLTWRAATHKLTCLTFWSHGLQNHVTNIFFANSELTFIFLVCLNREERKITTSFRHFKKYILYLENEPY